MAFLDWMKEVLAAKQQPVAETPQPKRETAKDMYAREAADESRTQTRVEALPEAIKKEAIEAASPAARLIEQATSHRDKSHDAQESPTDANLTRARSQMRGRARGLSR